MCSKRQWMDAGVESDDSSDIMLIFLEQLRLVSGMLTETCLVWWDKRRNKRVFFMGLLKKKIISWRMGLHQLYMDCINFIWIASVWDVCYGRYESDICWSTKEMFVFPGRQCAFQSLSFIWKTSTLQLPQNERELSPPATPMATGYWLGSLLARKQEPRGR